MVFLHNLALDIIGESYNTDSKPVVAISYAPASNKAYTLPDNANYIKPEMISRLPDVINPPKIGPLEPVEEVNFF